MNTQQNKIDWAAMSDRQIGYQFDCFELHGERIPKGLQREIDKRNEAREVDPLGSVEQYRLSERLLGA